MLLSWGASRASYYLSRAMGLCRKELRDQILIAFSLCSTHFFSSSPEKMLREWVEASLYHGEGT
jgi:hypothetical protein